LHFGKTYRQNFNEIANFALMLTHLNVSSDLSDRYQICAGTTKESKKQATSNTVGAK